jgi:hypothetical protein
MVPTTFTENVHVAPGASVAPLRPTEDDPTVAVIEPPPQEPVSPLGVATIRPVGNASVKATPIIVRGVGFEMLKPRVLVPLRRIVGGTKDFVKMGTSAIVNRTPDPLGKLPSWRKFTPKLESIEVPLLYSMENWAAVVLGLRIWICVGTLPEVGVVTTTFGSGRLIVVLAVTKAMAVYVNCVAGSPNRAGAE